MEPPLVLQGHWRQGGGIKEMADKAREKGRTERYLPKAAWASMTKEERKATDDKKKRESKGKPVNHQVKNTKAAAEARRRATSYSKSKS